jgi:hypothetical protein
MEGVWAGGVLLYGEGCEEFMRGGVGRDVEALNFRWIKCDIGKR